MSLKKRYSTRFALACLLLVGLILPFAGEASAQTLPYLVSVNPTETAIYSNVGQLVNFTFQAVWTYGDAAGQVVEYADVLVEVKTADGTVTDIMLANTTTTGFANFNYSSSTPQVLTFTPTKVFTPDETELNATLIQNGETSLYGLQSEAVTVYWDTLTWCC